MSLADTFFLFCENAEIRIENSEAVQYGTKYKVSRSGEEAYMTLYGNGNSQAQGHRGSTLLKFLQSWSNRVPGQRVLDENEQRRLSSLGMPAFYLSWREWQEDANNLAQYIEHNGEPEESLAPDGYKIRREIMFHDYMFKKATDLNIPINTVKHIIKSWLYRFCFMNINADWLADEVVDRLKRNWSDEISADGDVSFYCVTEELTYVFCRYCHDKLVFCNNPICPQGGDPDLCIIELVDSMYVYCKSQRVLSYTKTNFRHLLRRNLDKLHWIDISAQSPIEERLRDALYQSQILAIPQFQALAPDRRFKVDFLIKAPKGGAIAVECDGLEYHANANAYMLDRRRDNQLTLHGFQVLRFSSIDILNDLQGCIDQIEYSIGNFQHGRVVYHRNNGLGYFGANI